MRISLITLFASLLCSALNAQSDSSIFHKRHFVSYAEIYGHNYYGYQSKGETGILSLNFAYRAEIIESKFYIFSSVGWGFFKERHISQLPNQPIVYKDDYVHFFPIEATLQFGKRNHFMETGFAASFGVGSHWLYFSGSQGSQSYIEQDAGVQLVPRIGYVFVGEKGEFFRFSITPHFISQSLKSSNGSPLNVDRYSWVPVGISAGWAF